jgi:VanZ family protein
MLAAFAESLQFFAPGRTPTWDDVIYNVSGYLSAQVFLMILMGLVTLYVGYLQRKQKKPSSLK